MIKLELPPISDDELPYVSIVVPTRNRHHFFDLLMRKKGSKLGFESED